jgi:mycoredoxin-dependent peroxiredoxin
VIDIGDEAPDFELRDQARQPVKLSDLRGRPVALVFYPFSFTSVCTGELCQLRDDYAMFVDAGVQVLAVSCDSSPVQKAFADQEGYTFPVLADYWPHGEVARRYGVFDDTLGCATRATFVIDGTGVVVDRFTSDELRTPRPPARYEEAIAKL